MSCQQRAKTSDAELSAWLKSVLAVKPGGKHPDLAKSRKQNFGIAFGLPNCPRCGVKLERGLYACRACCALADTLRHPQERSLPAWEGA